MVYKLNPSINDLLNNNLYKLYIDEELFLVPLWYNEVQRLKFLNLMYSYQLVKEKILCFF